MPTTSLLQNAPNTNYNDRLNWTNGAPTAGDIVVIAVSPPNGPEVATNTAIVGQNIQLSNNGVFYTAGTTTLDATTRVTNEGGAGVSELSFDVTSAATFTNVSFMIGVQTTPPRRPCSPTRGRWRTRRARPSSTASTPRARWS